jgi:hypothetical protein
VIGHRHTLKLFRRKSWLAQAASIVESDNSRRSGHGKWEWRAVPLSWPISCPRLTVNVALQGKQV